MSPTKSPGSVAAMRRAMAASSAVTAEPEIVPEPAPAPVPAGQDKADKWPARISLTASPEMKRALDLARVDDGIEATARIRAMIALWQSDDRLRVRVDKLARSLR